MKVTRSVGAFSLVLLLASAASADPIQVYNTFGPGDSFNTQVAAFFGFEFGQEGSPDGVFGNAMSFVPTANADLSSLELALKFPWSFTQGSLQIRLFDSTELTPGALLESWARTGTGDGIFRFDSAQHPTLAAGRTYFIEATTVGRADGLWYLAPDRDGLFTGASRVDNGPWHVDRRIFETAFRVSGDPSVSATPEPASLLLLGTGLLLAVAIDSCGSDSEASSKRRCRRRLRRAAR